MAQFRRSFDRSTTAVGVRWWKCRIRFVKCGRLLYWRICACFIDYCGSCGIFCSVCHILAFLSVRRHLSRYLHQLFFIQTKHQSSIVASKIDGALKNVTVFSTHIRLPCWVLVISSSFLPNTSIGQKKIGNLNCISDRQECKANAFFPFSCDRASIAISLSPAVTSDSSLG